METRHYGKDLLAKTVLHADEIRSILKSFIRFQLNLFNLCQGNQFPMFRTLACYVRSLYFILFFILLALESYLNIALP